MKIYKLDIDAAQPTNQVVQMQQNTTGILSVNVTKNGEYIRNLSCQMFDGDTEISGNDNGFKLDIGDTPKHYTVKATATPVECSAYYIAKEGTTRLGSMFFSRVQLSTGVYRQDEFYGLAERFGNKTTTAVLTLTQNTLSNVNFGYIALSPLNTSRPVWFEDLSHNIIPEDTLISVDNYAEIGEYKTVKKQGIQISSYAYPAVGYYVDYQADTLIKPSTNANAYSEQDILPTEADFAQLSADSFTLSGVTYVPTTLSVDGVAYTVLAAPVATPEPEPETTEE